MVLGSEEPLLLFKLLFGLLTSTGTLFFGAATGYLVPLGQGGTGAAALRQASCLVEIPKVFFLEYGGFSFQAQLPWMLVFHSIILRHCLLPRKAEWKFCDICTRHSDPMVWRT